MLCESRYSRLFMSRQSQPSIHHTVRHVFAGTSLTEKCVEGILTGVYDWDAAKQRKLIYGWFCTCVAHVGLHRIIVLHVSYM